MVRSARYLEIIEEDRLVENAARVGAHLQASLERLQGEHEMVSNVRGLGLMIAFDLPDGRTRDELRTRCWEAGLATLICGTRSLRFRPPLTFSDVDVDNSMQILDEALSTLD
jgi:L-lysine 6-transaminase